MKTALVIFLLVAYTHALPLAFKKGKRYTFKYETEVVHAIPGGAAKQIGLRLRCDCHVIMIKTDEARIKLENVKIAQLEVSKTEKETLIGAVPQAIAKLQANPVGVVFTAGGQVKMIRVGANDPEWCRNFKRGIVNMLQIAPKVAGKDPKQILACHTPVVTVQKEPTIVGHCAVTYSVVPWIMKNKKTKKLKRACRVTKTIDYKKCMARPTMKESIFFGHLCPACQKTLGYVPYLRHAGQIEAVLINRFLMKAVAEEMHVFTPMSEHGGQIVATVRQRLLFHAVTSSQSVDSIELATETALAFKLVHPEEEVRQNHAYKAGIKAKVMEILQMLPVEAQKDIASHRMPQLVTELVAHLRLCDLPMLENTLTLVLKMTDERVRDMCIDALSLAGTKEVIQLLKKKHAILKMHMLRRIIMNLVFVPKVLPFHVNTVLHFCENVAKIKNDMPLRRQCLLSYGALVNRLSKLPKAQQKADIMTTLNTAIRTLKTKIAQATTEGVKLAYLKAMGNAGLHDFQATIVGLLMNTKLSIGLRVECVWALRKIVHLNKGGLRAKLIQVFAKPTNHPELRMAVVWVMLDKVPTFLNMQLLVNIVRRELQSKGPRSNQVASWVISKLLSMAYYDNNILRDRARRARLALRFAPKVKFGTQHSRTLRIAMFAEKFMGGFEMDVNKMNVPQSCIPRNMNARLRVHLMGHRIDVAEVGARVEGLEHFFLEVLSEIRSRQKRSIWDSVMGLFKSDDKDDREKSGPPGPPGAKSGPPGPPGPNAESTPSSSNDDNHIAKKTEVSMFMKLFGQEIHYKKITPKAIDELVSQIKDLVLGKKDEIDTALGVMRITKDSIIIKHQYTKAFLAAHARQLVPTLAGLPLHFHVVSGLVVHMNNDILIQAKPTLFQIFQAKSLKTMIKVKPKIAVFTKAFVQVHTPFVRVGVKMQNTMQMKPKVNFEMMAHYGKAYTFTFQNFHKATDVLKISPDPMNTEAVGMCGMIEIQETQRFKITAKEVPLQVSRLHIVQLEKMCYGQAMTGVNLCISGRMPDLSSMRFWRVPFFSTITQTRFNLQAMPTDNVKEIVIKANVIKNTNNKMMGMIIYKANGNIKRQVPISFEYHYNERRLIFLVAKTAPMTWGMNIRMDFKHLMKMDALIKIDAMNKYIIGMKTAIIDKTGRQMMVTLTWNMLPEYWKNKLKKFEPQFFYFLQTFASISTFEKTQKKIVVIFHITSPLTAQIRALSPLGTVQTKPLFLQMQVTRWPLSFVEILEWPFGHCMIQSAGLPGVHRVSIFDQKSYAINAQPSTCQYILLQDTYNKLIKIAVQVKKQGQIQLIILVHKPKKTMIIIKPDLSVFINNKKCKAKTCVVLGIGTVFKREQQVKVKLNIKHFIEVKYHHSRIKILASPTLRDRVRGLCGDYNGEDYKELRGPRGKVHTTVAGFVRSWRTKC